MSDPAAPIIVNPAAAPVVANTVVRDVLIVVAAFPIIVQLVGARDLNGILHWMQSSDGATVLAIVVPALLTAWRARGSLRRKAETVTIAHSAPDTVAVVVSPSIPLSVE